MRKQGYCLGCLNYFSSKEKLALHKKYSLRNVVVRIKMPDEGGVIKFKNHNHSLRVSLVVKPISGCERRSDKSFTNK